MMQSEQINELAAALAKAQRTLKAAIKDSTNPHFRSRYADLASIWSAWQEAGPAHGLAITQTTAVRDGGIVLITQMSHSSGQFIRGEYPLNPIKNDSQGLGSAMTYARRYSLAAMTGVCPDDDDGESAMGRSPVTIHKDADAPKEDPSSLRMLSWISESVSKLTSLDTVKRKEWAAINSDKLSWLAQNNADQYAKIELLITEI